MGPGRVESTNAGLIARLAQGTGIAAGGEANVSAKSAAQGEPVAINAALGGVRSIAERISEVERAGFESMARVDRLEDVGRLLDELKVAVKDAARDSAAVGAERSAAQARIDAIIAQITSVEEGAQVAGVQAPEQSDPPGDIAITHLRPPIKGLHVRADLKPGEWRDVHVEVLASAQVGGFFLSFGGDNLDLGGIGSNSGDAIRQFVIEIDGGLEPTQLAFASGSALADVAAAINSFSDVTGVTALVSGTTGIALRTLGFGADEFVGVKIVDDGGLGGHQRVGIYSFEPADTRDARESTRKAFSHSWGRLVDAGQDVAVTVNGVKASTSGKEVRARVDENLSVRFTLESGVPGWYGADAQTLGTMRAFTVSRADESAAGEGLLAVIDADLDVEASLRRLDEAQSRLQGMRADEQRLAEARSELLNDLASQLRASVGVQTGATSSDFDAAAAASALRAGLLGQPAPTPPPPSGGIEPGQSIRLLGEG